MSKSKPKMPDWMLRSFFTAVGITSLNFATLSTREDRHRAIRQFVDAMSRLLRGMDIVVVNREPGDRGTISVHGEVPRHLAYLGGSKCPDCGRVGHVCYDGGDWEAVGRDRRRRRKQPMVYSAVGSGDTLCECIWCEAVFSVRDLQSDYEHRLFEWKKEQRRLGYKVRFVEWEDRE